ncbi:hypothetical protein HMPREF1423_01069 [Helicobacter pylori GAM270ASi]|uniref:hypothetical protein n=1 Tax=Helicobacter pylori TaxID=210 RepID=UPI0002BB6359|nr:hypothetical protein [Helicobacter pylori]EMH29158.1 hypothetical protein HMPREF1423_01069 [Helicobacter pylori GAM270ASi]
MIHLVVFRAKSNAHDQILVGFLTNKRKVFQNKLIIIMNGLSGAMRGNNGGLNGVFLRKKNSFNVNLN